MSKKMTPEFAQNVRVAAVSVPKGPLLVTHPTPYTPFSSHSPPRVRRNVSESEDPRGHAGGCQGPFWSQASFWVRGSCGLGIWTSHRGGVPRHPGVGDQGFLENSGGGSSWPVGKGAGWTPWGGVPTRLAPRTQTKKFHLQVGWDLQQNVLRSKLPPQKRED